MSKCDWKCGALRRAMRGIERGRRRAIQRQAQRFLDDTMRWGLEGSLENAVQASLRTVIIELLFHKELLGSEINLDAIHADDCDQSATRRRTK